MTVPCETCGEPAISGALDLLDTTRSDDEWVKWVQVGKAHCYCAAHLRRPILYTDCPSRCPQDYEARPLSECPKEE